MDILIRLVVVVVAGAIIVPALAWMVVRLDARAIRRAAETRRRLDRVAQASEREDQSLRLLRRQAPRAAGFKHTRVG